MYMYVHIGDNGLKIDMAIDHGQTTSTYSLPTCYDKEYLKYFMLFCDMAKELVDGRMTFG